ncbi:MAG: hypothetical protein KKB50_00725 [Planctomycetes bacterium]|nr:hypothetical protein [Planctomycetota bacterium]
MSKEKKNLALGAVAVVVLAAAAFMLFQSRSTAELPSQFVADAVCLACGSEVQANRELTDRPPWKCPGCGERAVCPWMYCYDCQRRFVPAPIKHEGEPPTMPAIAACPQCGGTSTGSYVAEDPDQVVQGDLPLPKWP